MTKQKKMATMISNILLRFLRPLSRSGLGVLILCCCIAGFASCNPDVEANTEGVVITIDVQEVSTGFAQVRFSTNKHAFYLISIQPARENIDPHRIAKTFMLLSLDSAYVDYLYWRNQQLQSMTPFVADFASHSLQYGDVLQFFTLLQPDTDYWVYAFVVDPTTNKPAGQLFLETIHTDSVNSIPVYFEYRIDGTWDYIYPKDSLGEIISTIPWVTETVDSATIRQQGWNTPGEYFFSRFRETYHQNNAPTLYGIHARENNGVADDASSIRFELGKTYYTGMAILDAPLAYPLPLTTYDIYRFTWQGYTTHLYFTPDQSLNGDW